MSGWRARVDGRVQGVNFRTWTADKARALGVRGWVRNRRDGSVEIEAHGEDRAVEALFTACRRGPRAAKVERIVIEEAEGEGPPDFQVTATA